MTKTTEDSLPMTTEADVYNLYALALGRYPETAQVVAEKVGMNRDVLTCAFFSVDEHADNVLSPLEEGRRLTGGLFDQAPGEALCAWTEAVLPVSVETGVALRASAGSWHRLYAALFFDEAFLAFVGQSLAPRCKILASVLDKFSAVEGGVERLQSTNLKGWAFSPDGDDFLSVEARIEGEIVAVGAAREFRRDVQDRFGGDGLAGFTLTLDEHLFSDPRRPIVEVHERTSGLVIGSVALPGRAAPLAAHRRLAQEVAAVRRALEAIEAALPSVQSGIAFELEDYSDWHDAYVRPLTRNAAARSEAPARILVAFDARRMPLPWISDTLESLEAQTTAEWSALIVGDGPDVEDLATCTTWRSGRPVVVANDATAESALLPEGIEVVVRLSAPSVMEPDALERILAALTVDSAAPALFWDEDVLESRPDSSTPGAARGRHTPWFKTAFDADLLLQEPAIGSGLALTRAALTALGEGGWADGDASVQALRLLAEGLAPAHIACVLQSRQKAAEADSELWAGVVQAHLDRTAPGARAVVAPDPLGAPGAVRVEFPDRLDGVTATVIVPTRDRLDLLKPCVDSLLAAREANAVQMDLLIVDHLSKEPETRAYIDGLVEAGAARVIPYGGAYNWSLMNNLAAAQSEADVLVFLNNDTAVITPDWLDRLCRQAIRPDVGAVGARLTYADGTLQHAGFVSRPLADSFLMPEGMGVPAADGGYLGRHARLRRAAAVTGACMAVRSEVFRRAGGFDAANLPMDWNDVDLCLKVRAEGLAVIYEPAAALYHFESRSRGATLGGERVAASMRAASLVWARWGERFGADGDYNAHFDRMGTPFSHLRSGVPGKTDGA